jgi:D-3-phosphoglycerate dehydrogenase
MQVIAYDPYISEEAADKLGISVVSMDELFAKSDFISVRVPLTPETKGLLNKDSFKKMKKGVRIINCARGGIVVEADLVWAVKEGIVAGAACDVYEKEPPDADNPLLGVDEIILTPHLGASTLEAQENVAVAVSEQISDYLLNGTIRNAINVPSVPSELLATLSPYISLGEKIGAFQGQILSGGIEEVTIEYSGDVVGLDVTPITIACVKGLLSQVLDMNVNFVNASFVAQERGIRVIETKSSRSIDFASSITIKVKTKEGEELVEGALFGKREARIVRINQFFLDAIPEGFLLLLYNEDKPGVIGNVGCLLAKNKINIARLHLGRQATGGKAVSVWNIDTPLSEELIKEILALTSILSARLIKL